MLLKNDIINIVNFALKQNGGDFYAVYIKKHKI